MKNNYPIRYALVPMIEEWWEKGERVGKIVAYIVTKCYLVNETKKYERNGNVEVRYHVVCPYQYLDFDIWRRVEPKFNINRECCNGFITDKVYINFEKAIDAKNKKNDELVANKCCYIRIDENYEKNVKSIKNEYAEKFAYYNELESMISSNTEELDLNNKVKEQSVIMYRDGGYKKFKTSLYEAMNIFDNDDFIVYSVDEDEYKDIQKLMKKGKVISGMDYNPILVNDGDSQTINMVAEEVDGVENYNIIMYTIETRQDIVDSYKIYDDDINKIKILRKK